MNLYTIRTRDGIEIGPMSLVQLEIMVQEQQVKPATLIYTEDSKKWHMAATLSEIRELLQKHAPKPVPITRESKSGSDSKKPRKLSASSISKKAAPSTLRPGEEMYLIRTGGGVEYGPTNFDHIKKLAKEGQIKATTMIFTVSTKRWHLAASVPEVRALVRRYKPDQDEILDRLRSVNASVSRDHSTMFDPRRSGIRIKRPFWKRFFSKPDYEDD
jgi:hypothetical protein